MLISDAARLCIALSCVKGFGLKAFHQLRMHRADISEWPNIGLAELKSVFPNTSFVAALHCELQTCPVQLPHAIETWLCQSNCHLISYFDDAYPECLRQTHLAPAVLYAQGDVELLARQSLAIVGARKVSPTYARLAEEFGFALAKNNWVVVSGMALGVDTAAHRGALAASGATVAVLACGIDRCYPERNRAIYDRICEAGLLLSEMPLGTSPRRHNFPRRNRIVSGLAQGVLLVEAGEKSGSLITARYAIEQNREVYALPGAPNNLNSAGCNRLIRQGAALVSSVQDLFD